MPLSSIFLSLTQTRNGGIAETLRLLPQKGRRSKLLGLPLPALPAMNLQYSEVPFYEHVRAKPLHAKSSD